MSENLTEQETRIALALMNCPESRLYVGEERPSLSTLGALMGISRQRAQQIEARALKRIRKRMLHDPQIFRLLLTYYNKKNKLQISLMNTMQTQTTETEARLNDGVVSTGLTPDYNDQPSAFAVDTGADRMLLKIDDVYVASRLCALVERTSAQIGELAKRVACGVALTGWMVLKVKMANPRGFGKLFGKEGFSFSQKRGSQFLRCAAALHDRAVAAGVGDDFVSQMDAALEAFKMTPNAIPSLPVMDALENDKWVSVHAMMLELGVVRPTRVRQLPKPEPEKETPALPGLEELCSQTWTTASRMLHDFQFFMRNDVENLNNLQRMQLRESLKELLIELDKMDAIAPAMN